MVENNIVNLSGEIENAPRTPIVNTGGGSGNGGTPGPKPTFEQAFNQLASTVKPGGRASIPLNSFYIGDRYPTSMPGEDTEEAFGQQQSAASKFGNALVKTAGTFSSSFLGGTAGLIYGTGKFLTGGKLSDIVDNEVNRTSDNINKELEDEFANYYTKSEQNSEWWSGTNLISANFWGDKVLKNFGFAAGAIAGGFAWTKALRAIGLTNKLTQAGKGLEAATAIEESMSAVPNTQKYAAFNETLNGLAQKYLKNPLIKPLTNAERIVTSVTGAAGEGAIEAYQNMNDFRRKAIDEYVNTFGKQPVGDDLENINQYSDKVANYTLGANMLLLSISNFIQLPKILGASRKAEKAMMNDISQKALGEAWTEVGRTGFKRGLARTANFLGLGFAPSEAIEEAGQFAIQVGVNEFFNKSYRNKEDADSVFSNIYGAMGNIYGEGVDKLFNTKEGMESLIIGGLSGGLQQARQEIKDRGVFGEGGTRRTNTEIAIASINKTKIADVLTDQAKYVAISVGSQKDRQNYIKNNDILNEKDSEFDYVMTYLMPRVKYGKEASVQQELDHYVSQASTDKGFQELIDNGYASPNEKREQYLDRIAGMKELAQQVTDLSSSIKDKYEDAVTIEGEQKYSDLAIEKLVYAASKIDNYSKRIPLVSAPLAMQGIDVQGILGDIITSNAPNKKITKEVLDTIDSLDIAPEQKVDLKTNLADTIELSLRRKLFINEYEDIKKNPSNWTTVPKVEIAKEKSNKTILPPPPASGNTGGGSISTPISSPIIYIDKEGNSKQVELNREYINPTIDKKDPSHKFKVIKINDDGTVNLQLSDNSVVTRTTSVFNGFTPLETGRDNIIKNAAQIKEIQDEIEDKTEFSTGFEQDEYESGKEPAAPSADKLFFRTTTASRRQYGNNLPINVTVYNEFSNNLDSFPNRKNIRFIYLTYKQQVALGLNKLAELSYMKGPEFDASTEAEWVDSITGVDNGLVAAVFVEFDNGALYLIDKDGKRIKNQDGSFAQIGNANNNFDITQTVFSTTPTTQGTGRTSDDPKAVEHYRTLWKDKRAELFKWEYKSGDPIDSYEFGMSNGFSVKEPGKLQKNPIAKVFKKLKKSVISNTKGLIQVSTLGFITHKNGTNYKFALGRPVLTYGDRLEYLQNSTFDRAQAMTIAEVLKKLHNILVDPKLSKAQKLTESNKLTSYLKGVLYWNSKRAGHNTFFINYTTGNISIAGKEYDFSNIEGNKTAIVEALTNVYFNTSNELLTKRFDEPFYEQYWTGSELKERKWKNYQTYLLSDKLPDDKTARTAPLTVNIIEPTDAVPYVYEQKYAYPTSMKLAVPTAPVVNTSLDDKKVKEITVAGITFKFTESEEGPQFIEDDVTEKALDDFIKGHPKLSAMDDAQALVYAKAVIVAHIKQAAEVTETKGFDLGGTAINTVEIKGIKFTFTHDGVNANFDLSDDFLQGPLTEGVQKLMDEDPDTLGKMDPNVLAQSLIAAARNTVNQAVEQQLKEQAPKVSTPELQDLSETLDNYGLSSEFEFITPLLKSNNIQVSYDAAHMEGKLPKVASIDTKLVNGRYEIILTINRSTFDKESKAQQKYILAHEFVHGLIKVRLNEKGDIKGTELYKGLQSIFDDVNNYFNSNSPEVNKAFSTRQLKELRNKLDYISGSVEEMATLGLTDPDMIKLLKMMPGTEPAFVKKNLFTQLAELVSKLIGLSPSKFNDLLTFMSNQLEESQSIPTGSGLAASAQNYLNQPVTKQKRRKRNEYPKFSQFTTEQKYYLVQDFTAKFYTTLFRDNRSLFNIDTDSSNSIFREIITSYRNAGIDYTDEQYVEIIDATKLQLKNLYLTFNEDEVATINDADLTNRLYAPEAFSVDLKKSTPYAVKILMSSLLRTDGKFSEDPGNPFPKVKLREDKVDGKPGPTDGAMELIPESEVYSVLVNKLINVKDVNDFINKLYEVAQSNPDYVQLFIRLGGNFTTGQVDFDAMDDSDFRLFIGAMQTFTKSKPEMFIQYLKEGSTFRGAADLTNGAKQVEKRWINNMIINSKKEDSIIKYDRKEKQYVVVGDAFEIGTPEQMVDFLSKLGINFPMSTYDKLSEDDQNKFSRAVTKIHADVTSGKRKGVVTLKKGKFKTLGTGISRLAEMYTAVEMPNQNNSIYNAEGKRINTLTESNYPSVFEYQFNSLNNLSDIEEKMPYLKDVFSSSSEILKRGGFFFDEDGDRMLDDEGNPRQLKIQVISGEIDSDDNGGTSIARMNKADRYITEINQNINGSYYILVPADSSTEWMINLGNRISINQFAEGRGREEAIDIMRNHLDADVRLAADIANRSKLANVGNKGKNLRFFNDILSESTLKKFNNLIEKKIAEEIDEEEFTTSLNELKNSDEVAKQIDQYLIDSRDSTIERLEDLRLLNVTGSVEEEALYGLGKIDANFVESIKDSTGININSMSREQVDIVAEFLSDNFILNNIELHKLIFGDPYQFAIKNKNGKTVIEETKRIKMFVSPRKYSVDFPALNEYLNDSYNTVFTDTEDIYLDENDFGYHEHKSYINVSVLKDVEIVGGLYKDVNTNEADAFSIMSPGFNREVKVKNNQWTDEAQAFHDWQMAYARKKLAAKGIYKGYETKHSLKKYDEELTSKDCPEYVLDVIKPIVSGSKYGKATIDLAGHKMSQMPIYYQAVEGTALEDLFIKMFNEKRDYVVMESGSKVGTEEKHELYKDGKINDEEFNNLVQIPFTAYGIQVETGYVDKKGQTLGSQPTKIVTMDLFAGGQAIGATPERQEEIRALVERHDDALRRLYKEASTSLLDDLGIEFDEDGNAEITDYSKVAQLLKDNLIGTDSSDNLIESLQLNPQNNTFESPLEASTSYMRIARLLYSIVHKRVISPKVNGMSAVQVPVTGWEDLSKGRRVVEVNGKKVLTDDTLKFYEDADGSRFCEVMVTLPKQTRALFSDKTKFPNDEAIIDYLNKQSPDALKGIGFRIPNQALSSMERFVIKKLLPDFMGTTVVVPSEITTKAGSDFDIDKLNMYLKSLYKDAEGNIRVAKYLGSEEETKEFFGKVFDKLSKKEQKEITKAFDELDYEDIDAQELLIQRQEKLVSDRERYTRKMYRATIENEYFSAIDEILSLPENFKRLTSPNSAADLEKIANDLDELRGYDESTIKNRILNREYLTDARYGFIASKSWVGIAATAITGHSNAQKAGLFVDHIFNRILLQNTTPEGMVDLSQTTVAPKEGESREDLPYISENLSQTTNAIVDAGANPFILKILYSEQVVSSFMYLIRSGSSLREASLYLNQPIIRDFVTLADSENRYITSEIVKDESDIIDDIRMRYSSGAEVTGVDTSEFANNISAKKLTDEQLAEQQLILSDFFNTVKAANGLFIITDATNYDTVKITNADDFRRKQMKTISQYEFEQDSFRISSAKALLDKTHLRALVQSLTKVYRAFGTILRFNTPEYRAVLNKVIDAYAKNDFINKDKFSRIANKLSASLLDYIIQTNKNFDVAELVYGKDSVIAAFTSALTSYPNMKILQDLEVIPGRTNVAPATIAFKVAAETAADINRYTEGFRELRDNPKTNELYKKLVRLAIIQGTYKTVVSYREVIPHEDISKEIEQAINAPGVTEKLSDFVNNARFQRTNFNDPIITPRVNPSLTQRDEQSEYTNFGDEVEYYDVSASMKFNSQVANTKRQLIGLHPKSKGGVYDFVTVPRAIGIAGGDMVDYETGYVIQGQDYFAQMQKDESDYNKVYGYQKVKYPNTNIPVKIRMSEYGPELYAYKLVNLYGDGRFLTEYTNTLVPSKLENGTVKVNVEYSDQSIINWLAKQGKLVGYTESSTPVQQTTVTNPVSAAETLLTSLGAKKVSKGLLNIDGQYWYLDSQYWRTEKKLGGTSLFIYPEGTDDEIWLGFRKDGEKVFKSTLTYDQLNEFDYKPSKGKIVLNIIEQWVQEGKATTTVRNDGYHKSFYKGDGVYSTDGGNLVNITYRGLVKLQGDNVVGNGFSYTKDEFAAAEGYGNWANFEQGAKYAGKTLIDGGSVHLYDISPANKISTEQVTSKVTSGSGMLKLKDGKSYNISEINSTLLDSLGYTPKETGKLLKLIC